MNKPVPVPTDNSRPFWDGLREHEVRIQQCDECQHWTFYPRRHCPQCFSDQLTWKTIAGTGTLYSYTLSRVPTASTRSA